MSSLWLYRVSVILECVFAGWRNLSLDVLRRNARLWWAALQVNTYYIRDVGSVRDETRRRTAAGLWSRDLACARRSCQAGWLRCVG